MFKVLLVDDEPLILSGIKFMIDWQKNGCELVGAVRNGRQAIEVMDELQPDIVIADINMPVMNGIELVKQTSTTHPEVVFVMLTNFQEFELVREALRYKAVDYITKSQLEAQALEESISIAKKEAGKRRSLEKITLADNYIMENRLTLLKSAAKRLVGTGPMPGEAAKLLEEEGLWAAYSGSLLFFIPEGGVEGANADELQRLMQWELDVVDKLARDCFARFALVETDHPCTVLLLTWGDEAGGAAAAQEFVEKLSAASRNITGLTAHVLTTRVYHGAEQREALLEEIGTLKTRFYLYGPDPAPQTEALEKLALSGLCARLRGEINTRNTAGCVKVFDEVIRHVLEVPHEKAQGLWLCGELYGIATKALAPMVEAEPENSFLRDTSVGYLEIDALMTRAAVANWLQKLKNETCAAIAPLNEGQSELMMKAQRYIRENINKKILLQDVAEYVCLSPGYLSVLFKKELGQNFIDFVNQTKMEHACEMIQKGDYRIGEISYMLGFENAYYFSKVFRRHVGVSPTQYRHKMAGNAKADEE